MGQFPRIVTLRDAYRENRALMATCQHCGWMMGFHAWNLMCRCKGYDAPLADVAKRLRCRRCKRRQARLDWRRNFIEALMERYGL